MVVAKETTSDIYRSLKVYYLPFEENCHRDETHERWIKANSNTKACSEIEKYAFLIDLLEKCVLEWY